MSDHIDVDDDGIANASNYAAATLIHDEYLILKSQLSILQKEKLLWQKERQYYLHQCEELRNSINTMQIVHQNEISTFILEHTMHVNSKQMMEELTKQNRLLSLENERIRVRLENLEKDTNTKVSLEISRRFEDKLKEVEEKLAETKVRVESRRAEKSSVRKPLATGNNRLNAEQQQTTEEKVASYTEMNYSNNSEDEMIEDDNTMSLSMKKPTRKQVIPRTNSASVKGKALTNESRPEPAVLYDSFSSDLNTKSTHYNNEKFEEATKPKPRTVGEKNNIASAPQRRHVLPHYSTDLTLDSSDIATGDITNADKGKKRKLFRPTLNENKDTSNSILHDEFLDDSRSHSNVKPVKDSSNDVEKSSKSKLKKPTVILPPRSVFANVSSDNPVRSSSSLSESHSFRKSQQLLGQNSFLSLLSGKSHWNFPVKN